MGLCIMCCAYYVCQFGTLELQYIYIINQHETELAYLFHSVLIPHLSKHGKRILDRFPSQRASNTHNGLIMQSFGVFLVVSQNNLLNKQSLPVIRNSMTSYNWNFWIIKIAGHLLMKYYFFPVSLCLKSKKREPQSFVMFWAQFYADQPFY